MSSEGNDAASELSSISDLAEFAQANGDLDATAQADGGLDATDPPQDNASDYVCTNAKFKFEAD